MVSYNICIKNIKKKKPHGVDQQLVAYTKYCINEFCKLFNVHRQWLKLNNRKRTKKEITEKKIYKN